MVCCATQNGAQNKLGKRHTTDPAELGPPGRAWRAHKQKHEENKHVHNNNRNNAHAHAPPFSPISPFLFSSALLGVLGSPTCTCSSPQLDVACFWSDIAKSFQALKLVVA